MQYCVRFPAYVCALCHIVAVAHELFLTLAQWQCGFTKVGAFARRNHLTRFRCMRHFLNRALSGRN